MAGCPAAIAALLVAAALVPGAQARQAPARERHVVEVDRHPLVVWSRQPASPTAAMLLVHGRTWSARPAFDLQVPGGGRSVLVSLAARGIAAYAVDLRGYGETPLDASGWLTPSRAAADIRAVLGWIAERHPGLPPPVLVGWSLGGALAMLSASGPTARVSGLVVYGFAFDPGVGFADPPVPAAGPPPREPNTAEFARSDFVSPAVTEPAVIRAFVQQALEADPVRVDLRAAGQFNGIALDRLRVPVLFVYGRRDPSMVPDYVARLAARLPGGADIVVIGDGDHASHLEATHEQWIDTVVRFVGRIPRPDAFR